MDREAWRAAIHGVARSWPPLSNWTVLLFSYWLDLLGSWCLKIKEEKENKSTFSILVFLFRVLRELGGFFAFCISLVFRCNHCNVVDLVAKESESEVAQLCLTLCGSMDCSPPDSSMEFSRQEYWSGLPLPSPGNLPDPGIEPRSPVMQADALLSETPGKPLWVKWVSYINTQC